MVMEFTAESTHELSEESNELVRHLFRSFVVSPLAVSVDDKFTRVLLV